MVFTSVIVLYTMVISTANTEFATVASNVRLANKYRSS